MKSRIISKLNSQEISVFRNDVLKFGNHWAGHYLKMTPQSAPLRHGSSIYVQSLHVIDHSIIVDNRSSFANTIETVARLTGNSAEKVGRSYWHQLKPGERIDVHRDRDFQMGLYFDKIRRYQVFLKLPLEFVVVMDGELWNFDEDRKVSECLIEFNHSDWHYYANHSGAEVSFLVIDFFKE